MMTRAHAWLALGLVPLLAAACSSSSTGSSDGTTPTVDLPPANRAMGALRLEGSNGERWHPDGAADEASADLVSVPGHNAFWFAWSVFHPGTEVWEGDTIADATILEDSSGQCTIPCDEIFSGCAGRDCIPPLDSPEMVPVGSPELAYLNDGDIVLGGGWIAGRIA